MMISKENSPRNKSHRLGFFFVASKRIEKKKREHPNKKNHKQQQKKKKNINDFIMGIKVVYVYGSLKRELCNLTH